MHWALRGHTDATFAFFPTPVLLVCDGATPLAAEPLCKTLRGHNGLLLQRPHRTRETKRATSLFRAALSGRPLHEPSRAFGVQLSAILPSTRLSVRIISLSETVQTKRRMVRLCWGNLKDTLGAEVPFCLPSNSENRKQTFHVVLHVDARMRGCVVFLLV